MDEERTDILSPETVSRAVDALVMMASLLSSVGAEEAADHAK